MHKITLCVYKGGVNTFPSFRIRQQATITGNEDQMQFALDAARNIMEGIKWAKPEARVRVDQIELQR